MNENGANAEIVARGNGSTRENLLSEFELTSKTDVCILYPQKLKMGKAMQFYNVKMLNLRLNIDLNL